jgi:hypothetical protein
LIDAYTSIDTLPIWNFDKYLQTNDARYLLRLSNYDNLPQIEIPANIVIDLMQSYAEGSASTQKYINGLANIIKLRHDFTSISNAVVCLHYIDDTELTKIVKSRYKFDETDKKESLKNISKQLQGLKAKIEMKQSEFEAKFNRGESKSLNLYKNIAMLNKYYGCIFDPRTISVRYYLEMLKEIKNGR